MKCIDGFTQLTVTHIETPQFAVLEVYVFGQIECMCLKVFNSGRCNSESMQSIPYIHMSKCFLIEI